MRQADQKVNLPALPSHEDSEKYLIAPTARGIWFRDVVRVHPKALWVDGWEGPPLKDFVVKLRLKPDAVPKAQQPKPLGEFDQLRVDLRIEQEVESECTTILRCTSSKNGLTRCL